MEPGLRLRTIRIASCAENTGLSAVKSGGGDEPHMARQQAARVPARPLPPPQCTSTHAPSPATASRKRSTCAQPKCQVELMGSSCKHDGRASMARQQAAHPDNPYAPPPPQTPLFDLPRLAHRISTCAPSAATTSRRSRLIPNQTVYASL